jgi:hypothetical protein
MENHNIKIGKINMNKISGPENLIYDNFYEKQMFEKKLNNALLIMRLSRVSKKLKIHYLTKKLYNLFMKLRG